MLDGAIQQNSRGDVSWDGANSGWIGDSTAHRIVVKMVEKVLIIPLAVGAR
jgi:hypothetical protein